MKIELSDEQIVVGLRSGDRDAWDALASQYGERLWRFVARLIGRDRDAVADVFQETMLAAAKSGRGLHAETKLWAWLSRIGHNQAALYWRKKYRNRLSDDGDVAAIASETDDPTAELMQSETVECVRRLLAEMDAEQVAMLTAKYIDGLTVKQIAELLGGTQSSVKNGLAAARKLFRQRFEAHANVRATER